VTPFEKWLVWLSTAAVGVSGIVYGAMKYVLRSDDPYAVVHHPWQPFFLKLHVLSAPVLVFAVGVVFTRHVVKHWQSGRDAGRGSGVAIVATLVPMILSGYLIQTLTSASWIFRVAILHLAASAIYLGGVVVHEAIARGAERRRRAKAPPVL
jgi:hypothetical protein